MDSESLEYNVTIQYVKISYYNQFIYDYIK